MLSRDYLLGKLDSIRVAAAGDLGLGDGDRTFVMFDHAFQEQLLGGGTIGHVKLLHLPFGHEAVAAVVWRVLVFGGLLVAAWVPGLDPPVKVSNCESQPSICSAIPAHMRTPWFC